MTKPAISLPLLIALIGFPQIAETIFTPSLPDMARTFETTAELVNMSLSLYFFGFALGVLFFGTLCDRWGRRPAMLLGLGGYVAASLLCILSPTIGCLLASRLIQGFGASVGSVVTQTMMRDLFVGAGRSKIFSLVTATLALSPAIGPLIGGLVDEGWGFRGNLSVLLGLGIVLFITSLFALKESKTSATLAPNVAVTSVLRRMMGDKSIWKSVLLIGGCNGILFSFYGEAPYVFQHLLAYSPAEYGRMGFAIAFSSVVGAVLSHRLAGKVPPERVAQFGLGLTVFGTLAFWGLASADLLQSPQLAVVVILGSMFLIFAGFGLIIPNTIATALSRYKENLGVAGACFGLLYYVVIALLTEGMGLLHDGSIMAMPRYFLLIAVLMSSVYLPRRTRTRKALWFADKSSS